MPGDGSFMLLAQDGRVIEWSVSAEETFGWSAREAEGRHISELLSRAVDGEGRWTSAIVEALSTCSPMIFHVLDADLRILEVSGVCTPRPSYPVSVIGGVFTEVYELAVPAEEKVARDVLRSGRPVLDHVVRARVPGDDRRARYYSLSYIRVQSLRADGAGLVVLALDVSDRVQAAQRLRILEAVRDRVGEQLDVIATCRALTDAVVPALCGIAVVEIIDGVVRGEDPPLAPVEGDVRLLRAAFRGVVSAHPVGEVSRLPDATPFSRVLTDLRPRLINVKPDAPWLSADPARAASIAQSDAHSLIVAPLALRGQAMGVISFYRRGAEEPFEKGDLDLTADVCAHTALSIDNARRYTRERTIAATLKRRLLPQRPAVTTAVDIAHLRLPGPGAGGAWFDVIELSGARTALVLGDVAGRGVATATIMGQLRTVIHSLAALDLEPDELMARLSDTAARLADERAALPAGDSLQAEPLTAGCLIAVYDAVDQHCTMVRAGLWDPYVVYPDGRATVVRVPEGPVLAGHGHAPFPATTVELPEGSTLALCNEDLLMPTCQVGPLLVAGIGDSLDEVCDTVAYALRDRDETEKLLLLARVKALPADRVMIITLPTRNEAAPLARSAARRQLAAWSIPEEEAFTAELVVSELVGNAVRYGAPPLQLRLVLDRHLTCEVCDAAQCAPHLKHARTVDEDGRGLFIIASLADNWGTRYGPDGKTVWAQLPMSPST
ncbi:SpoIIE family protein phosphatase [Streptomyces sp. NPDC059766]|uniref:ATP-binding SpoIIE family protein phosphatase n=1 Tax=Streptomyces sp. NPDC059766 TaxID=3346940 RepID=UPI00364ADC65